MKTNRQTKTLNEKERAEGLATLDRILGFTVIMALFFPTLLAPLFSGGKNVLGANNAILTWGMVITFYMGIFLFLEWRRKRLSLRKIKWVNTAFIVNLIALFVSFLTTTVYKNEIIHFPATLLPLGAGIIIYFLPLVVFFVLFLEWAFSSSVKREWRDWRSWFKF